MQSDGPQAIALIPEVIDAIDDESLAPRDDDTGWEFTGHHAATVLAEMAYILDGITIEKRGRARHSFHDDAYKGGERLRELGRLQEVRANWETWWQAFRYEGR